MAIERVEAALAGESQKLEEREVSLYSGELTAPKASGNYGVEITAYDDAGNVTVADSSNTAGMIVEISLWHTPKTNWGVTDRFNIKDYNRIKNNLVYLNERASELWKPFEIEDMGADIEEYTAYWPVEVFNMWERNLEAVNKIILTHDYGFSQQFFENGPFIQYGELNRIESAILNMKDILDRQEAGLRRLSFRSGAFKEVAV